MSVSAAVRNPRAFVGGKYSRLKVLLFDPGRFFEEKATSDRMWNEIVVLLLIGLTGFVGSYYVAQEIMANFATSAADQGAGEILISGDKGIQIQAYGARNVVGIFGLWLGLTTAYYALSWLYSDRGSYFQLAKYTAWTLVPLFVYNLLKSIGMVVTAYRSDIVTDDMTGDVQDNVVVGKPEEAVNWLYGLVFEEPIMLAVLAVGLLFVVWSGYIGAHAVAEHRDIPLEDAYKVVAVPVGAYALWLLSELLGHAGVL